MTKPPRTVPFQLLLTLLLCWCSLTSAAETAKQAFDARLYQSSDDGSLPYRIHLPQTIEHGRKYPLILFFHGAGERGTDNGGQLRFGIDELLAYSEKRRQPVIIIAPQVPISEQWVDTPWTADAHTMPEEPSRSMRLTIDLLKETIDELPVDPERVYVTGLSMGGFATWDIIQRLPELFAAAIPVCGGGDAAEADAIKDIPQWAFHGDRDWVIKPQRSRDMIAALREAGGHPKYTEYPGLQHDIWDTTYANEAVWQWLFEQRNKRCSGVWRTLLRPGCW